MDPWGHLAPWLFKDIIGQEDGASLIPSLVVKYSPTK